MGVKKRSDVEGPWIILVLILMDSGSLSSWPVSWLQACTYHAVNIQCIAEEAQKLPRTRLAAKGKAAGMAEALELKERSRKNPESITGSRCKVSSSTDILT